MSMTNDEKRCLAAAKAFVDEAREQIGLGPTKMYGIGTVGVDGTMLGQIGAHRFETCVQAAKAAAKVVPHR